MNNDLLAEPARRKQARRYYSEYLAYACGDSWIRTRLSSFLAKRIQNFIETDTGHAYDIIYSAPKSVQLTEPGSLNWGTAKGG